MTYAPDHRPSALVKAEVGKASGVSAVALAIACAFIAGHEGKENRAYVDKLGKGQPLTVCYGSTIGVEADRIYTDAECRAMLLRDAGKHAEWAQKHLPRACPT